MPNKNFDKAPVTAPAGYWVMQAAAFALRTEDQGVLKDKSRWPYPPDVLCWELWPVRPPALLFAELAYGEPRYLNLWQTLETDPVDGSCRRGGSAKPAAS